MSAYGRTKKRARAKKRTRAEVEPKKRKQKKVRAVDKPKKKARARASKAKPKKKLLTRKQPAAKQRSGKKPASRKRTAAAVKPKARAKAKPKARAKAKPKARAKVKARAKAKPKARAKVKAKTRAKAKAKAKPARKRLSAAEKARRAQRRKTDREAVQKRLARLERARQDARRKANELRRPELKKNLRARKKDIEKRRLEQKLTTEDKPRKAKTELQGSRAEMAQRNKRRFRELLEKAKQKKQLPNRVRLKKTVDNAKLRGEQRSVSIDRLIEPSSVESILYKVSQAVAKMTKKWPIWYANLVFSGMGERLIGYGNRVLDDEDEDAAMFQTEGIESTGAWGSPEGMMARVRLLLEDYASELHTVIFLHYVKVMTFERKAEKS